MAPNVSNDKPAKATDLDVHQIAKAFRTMKLTGDGRNKDKDKPASDKATPINGKGGIQNARRSTRSVRPSTRTSTNISRTAAAVARLDEQSNPERVIKGRVSKQPKKKKMKQKNKKKQKQKKQKQSPTKGGALELRPEGQPDSDHMVTDGGAQNQNQKYRPQAAVSTAGISKKNRTRIGKMERRNMTSEMTKANEERPDSIPGFNRDFKGSFLRQFLLDKQLKRGDDTVTAVGIETLSAIFTAVTAEYPYFLISHEKGRSHKIHSFWNRVLSRLVEQDPDFASIPEAQALCVAVSISGNSRNQFLKRAQHRKSNIESLALDVAGLSVDAEPEVPVPLQDLHHMVDQWNMTKKPFIYRCPLNGPSEHRVKQEGGSMEDAMDAEAS